MDSDTDKAILILSKQILTVEREIVALRVAVTALRSYVGLQMNRSNPKEVLDMLHQMGQKLLAADPSAQKLQEASEIIDVFRKYGPNPDDPDALVLHPVMALFDSCISSPQRL